MKNGQIKISPNPAKDFVNIETSHIADNSQAELTDVAGNKLQNLSLPVNGKVTVSLKELKPGMYFVRLVSNGKTTETHKIIKE